MAVLGEYGGLWGGRCYSKFTKMLRMETIQSQAIYTQRKEGVSPEKASKQKALDVYWSAIQWSTWFDCHVLEEWLSLSPRWKLPHHPDEPVGCSDRDISRISSCVLSSCLGRMEVVEKLHRLLFSFVEWWLKDSQVMWTQTLRKYADRALR